uniref:Uncharacterized protein n=1 Tax=Attheya septentrionalis TaxID=420275 RepID=A0A6T7HAL3_9STRA|mmetsp:Transcript_19990/g.36310  ORF Transcript_19990/g.36310 Transcript_19990/m.36310 type:complete len:757 (+) Transcript_19990:188-2458(+)
MSETPNWYHTLPPDDSERAHFPGGRPFPVLEGPLAIDLGDYQRLAVSNLEDHGPVRSSSSSSSSNSTGTGNTCSTCSGSGSGPPAEKGNKRARAYFDLGLRSMFGYQHEKASKCFLACLTYRPDCALVHGLIALCHSPNYNFKGDAYYESTDHEEHLYLTEINHDLPVDMIAPSLFPSQRVAERHSRLAVQKVEELREQHRKRNRNRKRKTIFSNGAGESVPMDGVEVEMEMEIEAVDDDGDASYYPTMISEIESQIVGAIRLLTCQPGVDPRLAEERVARPYVDAMTKVYMKYPNDAEVAYFFAESLMVLNAWSLYEYPTGKSLSEDVTKLRNGLESALKLHPEHAGLCHMYVHLCEMSSDPAKALPACATLRTKFPDAGHLTHMPTHIDVLVGDYESCVRYNYKAIHADMKVMTTSPDTAGPLSFYFGYIVHNYHMLVYGAILGAMEGKAMETATMLNGYLNERLFMENPDLTAYLESYSALEIHVLVRFGRWHEILKLELPHHPLLMLYRSAMTRYARALAFANLGDIAAAKFEADVFDHLRAEPCTNNRILHNNTVAALLAVDSPMIHGEIAYNSGNHQEAFSLLRQAIVLQDGLNYDEPWGKMQPIRHALGGLLLEQGFIIEAEQVFRDDLRFHPKNPWGLTGLIQCLKSKLTKLRHPVPNHNENGNGGSCCRSKKDSPQRQPFQNGTKASVAETEAEIKHLSYLLSEQQKMEWVDFKVTAACMCCRHGGKVVGNPVQELSTEQDAPSLVT